MNISVTKTKVSVDTDYILNDSEYNVNECTFSFSDEYTEDLVKKAIFIKDTSIIEMSIINNKCSIPYEVLKQGQFQIHVYAYEVEGDNLILRYSPSYATVYVRTGSYVENAESPEEITPTQFEQYMQAMNDGLNEVANVDIDASKSGNTTTITVTNRDDVKKTVQVLDGVNGTNGTDGKDGITPTIGDNGNWYLGNTDTGKPSRGATGETGAAGQDGQNGVGVPTGGTQGQVLAKIDNTNYNTQWITPPNPDLSNYYTKIETNNLANSYEKNRINYVLELTDNSNNKPALSQKNILSSDYSKIQDMIQHFIDNNINRGLVKIKIGTFPTIFGLASLYSTSIHILCLTETDISFPTGGEYNVCFTKFYSSFSKTNDTVTSINSAYWLACFNANSFGNYLAKNNNTAYTPTNDYNPSTKKYVDDSISSAVGNINTVLASLTTVNNGGGN